MRAKESRTSSDAPSGLRKARAKHAAKKPRSPRIAEIPGIDPDAQPLAPARSPDDALRSRAGAIFDRLAVAHADARCALEHHGPFELLVMTILSAQCTDETVNRVAPALFAKYPDARAMAAAKPQDVMAIIKPTGFFRAKANNIIGASRALVERHDGSVPRGMAELTLLPGVGRKTANIVRGNAFGLPGMGVDTHVRRLSQRMALTRSDDPVVIEGDLCAIWPAERWTMGTHYLIFHGRRVCQARSPKCEVCVVQDLCPSAAKFLKARRAVPHAIRGKTGARPKRSAR